MAFTNNFTIQYLYYLCVYALEKFFIHQFFKRIFNNCTSVLSFFSSFFLYQNWLIIYLGRTTKKAGANFIIFFVKICGKFTRTPNFGSIGIYNIISSNDIFNTKSEVFFLKNSSNYVFAFMFW